MTVDRCTRSADRSAGSITAHRTWIKYDAYTWEGNGALFSGDEGTAWIKGHHLDDSDEVLALRAAHALARS